MVALEKAEVIFVLGGPGAGKGTQCERLIQDFSVQHLSAGELLRQAAQSETEQGRMISDIMKEGLIVPMHITIGLLKDEMLKSEKHIFLIDGFPRRLDQGLAFEEQVKPCKFVLFFDVSEEEMERRLLSRGATSGRCDDNAESIRKRFRTFREQSMEAVEHYDKLNKLKKIDAGRPIENVYVDVKTLFVDL
eukprot:GCRY01001863.1.p1 GENE.GCRY01001863.1~~GCRY01001863.1.p1  ORF type:complete len:191 (-),score=31.03 GCRY01001863.1:74-646(-)